MSDPQTEKIRRAAHEWRAVLAQPPVPPVRQRAFDEWRLADPRHQKAFDQAQAVWVELGEITPQALDHAVLKEPPFERWRARIFSLGSRIADGPFLRAGGLAAACLAMMVGAYMFSAPASDWFVPAQKTIATDKGEIDTITLADGSRVTLGADSIIKLQMNGTKRQVHLTKGDAFFDVASDPERPFEVHAGAAMARVLGTQFDVQYNDEWTQISVAEGTVQVTHALMGTPQSDKTSNGMDHTVRLDAGERVAARREAGLGAIVPINPDEIGAWRQKRLIYVGASLAEIVADANRHHDRRIVLLGDELRELKVTASFSGDDIDGMLATLVDVFPVKVDRFPSGEVVISARN